MISETGNLHAFVEAVNTDRPDSSRIKAESESEARAAEARAERMADVAAAARMRSYAASLKALAFLLAHHVRPWGEGDLDAFRPLVARMVGAGQLPPGVVDQLRQKAERRRPPKRRGRPPSVFRSP